MIKISKSNNRTMFFLIVSLLVLIVVSIILGITGFLIGNSLQKSLTGGNVDIIDVSTKCLAESGNWIGSAKECENVSEPFCRNAGGTYNACASPCRNQAGEVMCIQMCVQVCAFK